MNFAISIKKGKSGVMAITCAFFVGLLLVHVAGHLQAHSIHGAAHDVRHSTGFPCH